MNHKIFSILILSFLLLADVHFALPIDSVSVSISEVKVGNLVIDQSRWKNISLVENEQLSIGIEPAGEIRDQIFYKVFLDGNPFSTNRTDKQFLFNRLAVGTHILKITPTTSSGSEGIPILLSFSVTAVKSIEAKEPEISKSGLPAVPYLDYILGGLIVVQFMIIVVLLSRKKKSSNSPTVENLNKKSGTDDLDKQEVLALNRKLATLKDELQSQKQTNELLRQQLNEVNTNVQDLERANLHLLEQKEKLEQGKYKLELLHAQKEEMFAMAIHDIKNPASAIRGYIDLLNSFDLNAIEQQEIMVSLVATSEDIVKMSQDMCSILAKAMPEPTLNFKKHNINHVIETVLNQNSSYSKTKKVKLVKKISSQLPELNIDAEKIEEALDNLLNNAIKFAPQDTIVELSSYLKDEKMRTVVVAVRDTGVGLSEEDLRRSFQKGATLSAKPTGLEQSSGLGLWIVKKIIEEHGGKVWVESKLGVGSTFGFELPVE
ncbi:MAG: HAMP domain-containing sensor histidine kinase [Ignavibacteria bacterium]|nr:HAMP domain-containing sensor histidine kinase [Ignavibacteria bacterium]